ncbi:MAG: TMEM175 family protein [Asticcacaulis sp.]
MKTHDTPEKSYDLERLIFFSDGVFAIAITLLVIEMHPPTEWDGSLISLMQALAPKVLYYAISFSAIGAFWMSHRLIFRYVQTFRETVSWFNLLFLLLIGLMPLATAVLQEGQATHSMSLAAVEVYVGLICLLSVVVGLLWGYVSLVAKLVDPRVTTHFKWITLVRLAIIPPVMCSASLWFGARFGLWPAMIFVAICAFISGRIHSSPFGKAAPAEQAPPIT